MRVLNFYSSVFGDQLRRGRKTATIRLVLQFLMCHVFLFGLLERVYWTFASTSDSRRTRSSSPSTLISVPPYLL